MMLWEGMRHLLFLQPHFSSLYIAAALLPCTNKLFHMGAISCALSSEGLSPGPLCKELWL